jgi:hypothetical protein
MAASFAQLSPLPPAPLDARALTGREAPRLDRVVLLSSVVTYGTRAGRRRRVAVEELGAAHELPEPPALTGWLQAQLRPRQVRFLRERVLPYLDAGHTVELRRVVIVQAALARQGNEDGDAAAMYEFSPEEWARADLAPERWMRCMPWHPHLHVWCLYEIVASPAAAAAAEEEQDEEQDVAEDEDSVAAAAEEESPLEERSETRELRRRCALVVRRRWSDTTARAALPLRSRVRRETTRRRHRASG